MEMKHCMACGAKLGLKYHEGEGREIPWCPECGAFRYPMFNTAVSMVVLNRRKDRTFLIRQYGKPHYILVAGYVNQGEDAEDAVVRELREEMDFTVESIHYNCSHYFAPSNTLMLNFTVTVAEDEPHPNEEIDSWSCFTLDEAREAVKPSSLARAFLLRYLDGKAEFPRYH